MRRGLAVLVISLAALLGFAGPMAARAADSGHAARTPEQIIAHHFATIAAGDLDAVMSDYADDAVVITAAGITRGKAGIRAQFARIVRAPQAGQGAGQGESNASGAAAQRRGPDIIEKHFTANVAWLIWVQNRGKPNELRGVETYLIRGGRIHLETVGTVNVHPAATAPSGQQ